MQWLAMLVVALAAAALFLSCSTGPTTDGEDTQRADRFERFTLYNMTPIDISRQIVTVHYEDEHGATYPGKLEPFAIPSGTHQSTMYKVGTNDYFYRVTKVRFPYAGDRYAVTSVTTAPDRYITTVDVKIDDDGNVTGEGIDMGGRVLPLVKLP